MSESQDHYVHGQMDVSAHKNMFSGFGKATAWASLILLMSIGYATFTLTMGVNWLVSLVLFALFGLVAGAFMGLGGGWVVMVVGLAISAAFIQLLVTLGGALMN